MYILFNYGLYIKWKIIQFFYVYTTERWTHNNANIDLP